MKYQIGFGRTSGFPYLICPDGKQIILRSGYGNGYLYELGGKFMFADGATNFRDVTIKDFNKSIREDALENPTAKEHLRKAFLQALEDFKCPTQLA